MNLIRYFVKNLSIYIWMAKKLPSISLADTFILSVWMIPLGFRLCLALLFSKDGYFHMSAEAGILFTGAASRFYCWSIIVLQIFKLIQKVLVLLPSFM